MYNFRTKLLVNRAITESRIRKWFKRPRKKNPSPSKLLTSLLRPKKGIHLHLTKEERMDFVRLIREMHRKRKIISKYRKKYGRRPKLFYKKVLGFPPRESQTIRIFWNINNIHLVFNKNDLISFWRKVQWGPGSGGYYPLGDRDIKIQELRGMISFGREEKYPIETRDIMRHESVHSFEGSIKKRKQPLKRKPLIFYKIKSELNAYLPNLKCSQNRKIRKINEWARLGMGLQVSEIIKEYLNYNETVKEIKNLKSKIRRLKSKRQKNQLSERLKKLKQRLERKKKKKRMYLSLHLRTINQIKKALEIMPVKVLERIIYETPYERLNKKIPETVRIYKRMNYEWYRNN